MVYVTFDEMRPLLETYGYTSDEKRQEQSSTAIPLHDAHETDATNLTKDDALLDHLRNASLVLIFMKHLDHAYLTAVR